MKFHFFKAILDDVRAGLIEHIVSQLKGNNINSILLSSPLVLQTSNPMGGTITGIEQSGKVNIVSDQDLTDTYLHELSLEDLVTLLQSVEEGRYQVWDDAMVNA